MTVQELLDRIHELIDKNELGPQRKVYSDPDPESDDVGDLFAVTGVYLDGDGDPRFTTELI